MKYIATLFIFLFSLPAFSTSVKQTLKQSETLMETHPDSVLRMLKDIYPEYEDMSDKNKALFGLLYFQALNKNYKDLSPEDLIDFSINYYEKRRDFNRLAYSYLYKARMLKDNNIPDQGNLLLKSLESAQKSKTDYSLLGRIYYNLGLVSTQERDYNKAKDYYIKSTKYFEKVEEVDNLANTLIGIGNVYLVEKEYEKAFDYYSKALTASVDSAARGLSLLAMGSGYFNLKQYDSALSYTLECIKYPSFKTNEAIAYCNLGDIYFHIEQYDSAKYYATKALEYSTTYFNKRECYRILANAEYNIDNESKKVVYYMGKYQDYNDSVRIQESHPKVSHSEIVIQANKKADKAGLYNMLLAIAILIVLIISFIIIRKAYIRAQQKQLTAEKYQSQIHQNNEQWKQDLLDELEIAKAAVQEKRRSLNMIEKEKLDKQIYTKVLLLDDPKAFRKLMNKTLNNLPDKLEKDYSFLNYKEKTWCCLFLLDLPLQDIAILLEFSQSTVYKFKQRLAKKMGLAGTKELEHLLRDLIK